MQAITDKAPEVLLILGTDASGKNHVANFITDVMKKSGHELEKRDGWFFKKATDITTSEDKSRLDLLKETVFLCVFPFFRFLFPFLLFTLIKIDLRLFGKSDKKIIVISHTGLRILAFTLGHVYASTENIRVPRYLDKALREIARATNAKTIVLDIDDEIRKNRVAKRMAAGRADNFDRYMAGDGIRSERIESFLVWLGVKYLGAVKIENNDLTDDELLHHIGRAFDEFENP